MAASNTTSNLDQTAAVFYDKSFVENLKSPAQFLRVASKREIPAGNGSSIKLYSYTAMSADTTAATEGTPGSGSAIEVVSATATPATYADFLSFSSLSLATAIDPVVENTSKELAYALSLSLSAILRTTLDGGNSVDSTVKVQLDASSTSSFTPLSLDVLREQCQALAGRAVMGVDGNYYGGVIHPFAVGDLTTSSANNSLVDILKHTDAGLMKLNELGGFQEEAVEFPSVPCKFFQSNHVTQTSNYKSVTGLTALRTYIVGNDGIISVPLVGQGDTAIGDGNHRNMVLDVQQNAPASAFDPSGLIQGWAAYRVNFAGALPPGTTQRYRYIDAASAIS